MHHPRVLHVGFNAIGSPTNTGLTLASMFGAWPRENLFELYTHSGQSRTAAGPNIRLAPLSTAPADGLVRALMGERLPKPVADGLNNSVRRPNGLPLKTRIRLAATTLNDVGPVWTGGGWLRDIEEFQPQVIHSLLGGVRITKFVAALASRLELPVVPHFMDDWMDNLFNDGQLWGMARRETERSVRRVLEHTPRILTIGSAMQAEYAARLERPADVVGNSADFDHYDGLVAQRHSPMEGPLTLRYVGGLHLGRADVLHSVGGALIGQQHGGRPWELALNVPDHDLALAERLAAGVKSITNGGNLVPSEVPRTIVNSDALLFLESSDPNIAPFTRLSVSTKVPEYLASGRPVLAIGPPDQASIQTLLRTGVAVHGGDGTSDADVRDALPALNTALQGTSARHRHAGPAIRDEFGRSQTQERLRQALMRAAKS